MASLDHIVIHVGRGGMDAAVLATKQLGFTLTERGFHSMGSINHLSMFGTDYLELLGVPDGDYESRPDLQDSPLGLNGMVFKTQDADATFRHLQAVGMAAEPPKSFHRPVETDTGTREAQFRTVTVRSDVFACGRVYFCEHTTPELVWRPDRPEQQLHSNGAASFREMVIVSEDPAAEAANFALLLNATATPEYTVSIHEGFQLVVLSWASYRERFGDAALAQEEGRSCIFGAVSLACIGAAQGVRRLDRFGTLFEFCPTYKGSAAL
jgi:hypothetical protein